MGQLASCVLLGHLRWCREWLTDEYRGNKLNLQELFAVEGVISLVSVGR